MQVYHLDSDGGFTCGDTDTEHTAYAYPTSTHATAAKRNPAKVARQMLRQANYLNPLCYPDIVARANARNWLILNKIRFAA